MAFVTRSGSGLQLSGSAWRFAGANAFWLGLVSDVSGTRYPSNFEIDDCLNTAKEMGASVVRAHTLGVSVGASYCVWPTLNPGTPNLTAFNSIDYAIYRAGQLGIRLIIPLTDQNRYYYGGKHTFTDWRSISDETQFYTNAQVILDFKAYISVILNRVNQFDSVAYKNHQGILCWETGNELSNPFPASTWTDTISTYIKSIDSNHLVLDGCYGVQSGNLALTNVDIYSNHFYPPQIALVTSDSASTNTNSKAYLVGECDWRPGVVPGAGTSQLDATTFADGVQSLLVNVLGSSANVFNVQVQQKSLSLSAGVTYTCSFWAKASQNRTIQIAVQKAVTPFTVYTLPTFNITTAWVQYSFTFNTTGVNDSNAMVCFNLANSISTVWLDGVSLTAPSVANMLTNPSFENGTLTPWIFQITTTTPDSYPSFISSVEGNTNISGDMIWLLMPHNDVSGFTIHADGYAIYYPNCLSSAQATQIQTFRTHAYTMQGVSVPAAGTVGAPLLTSGAVTPSQNALTWRGVAGGLSYSIERASSQNGAYSVLSTGLLDSAGNYVDASPIIGAWYRMKALNTASVAGAYSASLACAPLASDGRALSKQDGLAVSSKDGNIR